MCKFCEGKERKYGSRLEIYITNWDNGNKTLSVEYSGMEENGDDDFEINYCPICGKDLNQVQESTELTEALETLKDNGYICESNKHFELWQYKLSVKKEINNWLKKDPRWESFQKLRGYCSWECYIDIVEQMKEDFENGKSVEECVEHIKEIAEEAYKIGG